MGFEICFKFMEGRGGRRWQGQRQLSVKYLTKKCNTHRSGVIRRACEGCHVFNSWKLEAFLILVLSESLLMSIIGSEISSNIIVFI